MRTHTHTHTHIHIHIHIHTHTCTHTLAHAHTCKHTHTHTRWISTSSFVTRHARVVSTLCLNSRKESLFVRVYNRVIAGSSKGETWLTVPTDKAMSSSLGSEAAQSNHLKWDKSGSDGGACTSVRMLSAPCRWHVVEKRFLTRWKWRCRA